MLLYQIGEDSMQNIWPAQQNGFVSFLKEKFAAHGVENISLRDVFIEYIGNGSKYVTELSPVDRHILKIDKEKDCVNLAFKFFVENNEYLELEFSIFDTQLNLIFAESPIPELVYDLEHPRSFNKLQLINLQNGYGMTLSTIFEILFNAVFSKDPNSTIHNALNLTHSFDLIRPEIKKSLDHQDDNTSASSDSKTIWLF